MTPHDFIETWKTVALSERAAAQSHFIDLCRLVGHPTPIEFDKTGETFTFEKGVPKTGGGDGWADVWKKDFFAFEYKKKKRDLDAAMKQLTTYAAGLENPPIHVACDTHVFRIETRYTAEAPARYEFELEDLGEPRNLDILRAVFFEPEKLRSKKDRAKLTEAAAAKFQAISANLQHRNPDREAVAHFVNQLVFCYFADGVGLLPKGLWHKLLLRAESKPAAAKRDLDGLFEKMGTGGEFALEDIHHFNGGLFDGRGALDLTGVEIGLLTESRLFDWSLIDPTIFGTLFERFLDPDKRAQIGAHYTDPAKIALIVEPVILRPLRREWVAAKAEIAAIMAPVLASDGVVGPAAKAARGKKFDAMAAKAEARRDAFVDRLCALRILDPACGSGNFLYLALQGVKDIELVALLDCEEWGLRRPLPRVGPEILRGIEINPFAAELARTTIWIGDIQWRVKNAISHHPRPVLRKLDSIECRDALLSPVIASEAKQSSGGGESWIASSPSAPRNDGGGRFVEAEWPEADYIVGNPPFLGTKRMIGALGETEARQLRDAYDGRVVGFSDLVCWWFEKARTQIANGKASRAGLVATNSIRGGSNRFVLDAICRDLRIFSGWSDEEWTVDGAAVRVSLVCFAGKNSNDAIELNGKAVAEVHADLTEGGASATANLTKALRLSENRDVGFVGTVKAGQFDVVARVARAWLQEPLNPNGRPNSDVVKLWFNTLDVVRRPRDAWVVDFGSEIGESAAALFASPFTHALREVKPARDQVRRATYRSNWWRFAEPCQRMREAIAVYRRVIATPTVAKHRVFVWLDPRILPDHQLIAIARDDDTTFGVLHSRFHEAWSLRLGTWLGVGNDPRYTPTTTFETFPFPAGLTPNIPAATFAQDPRAIRIAAAAKRLDDLRRAWLNPPDLVDIVPEIVPTAAPGEAPRKYPDRILPKNAEAAVKLKARTLTNLYNERPRWLSDAHDALDRAVASAYGWSEDISTDEALAKLLALNLDRAARDQQA